ncbi:MAG: response regulator [Desulfobacterales bacterium]|jgi:PAS domain S-box-containing protein
MSDQPIHILLVEDDSAHTELISRAFEDSPKAFLLAVAATLKDARSYLAASNPDLVIVDFLLPDGKGTDLLAVKKKTAPYPIVMMTAYGNQNLAVEAMKAGALDYVVKSEGIFADMPHIAARALREWNHITQRKQAEKALKEHEALLRAVMAASPVGICLELDQAIRWHNDGLPRILGFTNGSLIGKKFRDFYPDDDEFKRTESRLFSEIRVQGIGKAETKWVKENGETIDCYLQSTLLDHSNASSGMIMTITDVSEKNKLQQRLIEAQKMEAVGTLAGGIAHDFNNILAAVMGNAEMGLLEEVSDSAKHNLDQILKATHRAKNLVKQILTYSRKSEPVKKPFRIGPIVHETLKLIRATIPATIEIQPDLEECTGVIQADPTQINQILLNLCANSAQAMEEKGGMLAVRLMDLNLDSENAGLYPGANPGAYVKLIVTDAGTGIAPDNLERIFDPYFTTKEAGKGTGMGLAVAYGIIKSHGGHIKVYSELGKGTTFEVLFPRIISETVTVDEKIDTPPMGNEKILFVDDEDFLVDLAKRMLEKLGYQVVVKQSPIEALEVFKDQPDKFDIVISDMTMPGLTGLELAQKLMAIRSDIPFILCTGYNERVSEENVKDFGIKEFLMKPLEFKVLAKTIRRALEK